MAPFIQLLKLLWTKRNELLTLFDKLPLLLHDAGEGIESAGKNTRIFGAYLHGGEPAPTSARQITAQTAEYLNASHQLIKNAAQVIGQAGNLLNQVNVPMVKFSYVTMDLGPLGTWKVVERIDIENKRLFDQVAGALHESQNNFTNMGNDLKKAAEQLEAFSRWFDVAGKEMDVVGDKLIQGGRALQEIN